MNQNERLRLRKSQLLAGFLSMLPGLGQAYVGYYVSGFINIAVVGALISLLSSNDVRGAEPFLGLFLSFFWFFNVIDAVRKAKLYNLSAIGETASPVPTDSPLLGGVALVVIGILLTLTVTFDIDLDWLEDVWPLFLLALGFYLLWKYQRARKELKQGSSFSLHVPPPPQSEVHPTPPFTSHSEASGARFPDGEESEERRADRSE